jgi:Ca2+-dependent lipid-binding protein
MKEWQFAEGEPAVSSHHAPSLSRIDSVSLLTGRTIRVTVAEGRDLMPADYTGFSDPYVKLQYGNITRKTKTVSRLESAILWYMMGNG